MVIRAIWMPMKRLFLLSAFSFITMMLFSCVGRPARDDRHVIATLRGPSSLGMLYFIDSLNNVNDAGFEIRILNEPLQVRKMMLDGSADFAVLPTTMAALIYNKGVDYRMAAVSTWGTLYLCGNDTTIRQWNDLENNKVYLMAKNMTPDVLFRHLLLENGLEPYSGLDLDYRFPSHLDLANATAAGIAPMSVISEPYLSNALLKNPGLHILMSLHDEWTKIHHSEMPETAFICKGELKETNPQLVDNVVNIYKNSVNRVNSRLDEAAQLAVRFEIIADSVAARNSIPRSNLKVVGSDECKSLIADYLSVFYKMDPSIIGGKMPDEKFY